MKTNLAILFLLASTTIAAADTQIVAGSTSRGLRSSSANALTSQSLGGALFGIAYELPVELVPRLGLWTELNFGWGSAEGAMFQTLDTSIDTVELSLGGRARYAIIPHVAATGRLALGTIREAIGLDDRMGHTASSSGWGATTTISGGVELLAIDHPKFGLGIRFEMGYTAATEVNQTTTPDRPDDGTIKLPMTNADFGKLDLGGPFLGFQVLGRF